MGRSFEAFDMIRLKQPLFNLPKHTIGKVLMVTAHDVHVVFTGEGVAVLAPHDIELIPRVVNDMAEQLALFQPEDLVKASIVEDKVIITQFIGTSDNIVPEDPDTEVISTKRQIWYAWLHSTDFEEFRARAGFRKAGA